MSSFRPFAERVRALTLLEVMVSQTIAIILIAAMTSLVVTMVTKLSAETNVSDAQVRLRQASHLILRDSQGVGGELSQSGDLVVVEDNVGGAGPDRFTLFKRDESICGGSVAIPATNGVTVSVGQRGTPAVCPIGLSGCSEADILNHRLVIVGPSRSIDLTGHSANAAACKLVFPTGADETDVVARYNAKYGTSVGNMAAMLADLAPANAASQILFGTTFRYSIGGTAAAPVLLRSVNGAADAVIVDNIADMQIERVYDIDANGIIAPGEIVTANTIGGPLPAGANEQTFLALRIGLVAFSRASDGLIVAPPPTFSNHNTSTLPGGRRYRATFVTAAARNRSGS